MEKPAVCSSQSSRVDSERLLAAVSRGCELGCDHRGVMASQPRTYTLPLCGGKRQVDVTKYARRCKVMAPSSANAMTAS